MHRGLLDGKRCAAEREIWLGQSIQTLGATPTLAVILIGNDPASALYVRHKQSACHRVGIRSLRYDLPASASDMDVLTLINTLNQRDDVHGVLVQLPLPPHVRTQQVLEAIDPRKDVDGFHPTNLGYLAQQNPRLRPCTPMGIMALLAWYGCSVKGHDVVVVGASNIVGRPMALELLMAQATVTVCHQQTQDLEHHVRRSDVLIAATGNREAIDAHWIHPGSVVVDVGIHRLDDGRIVGDLDGDVVEERASWYTPVPGGVGPMTISALLENTYRACAQQLGLPVSIHP